MPQSNIIKHRQHAWNSTDTKQRLNLRINRLVLENKFLICLFNLMSSQSSFLQYKIYIPAIRYR